MWPVEEPVVMSTPARHRDSQAFLWSHVLNITILSVRHVPEVILLNDTVEIAIIIIIIFFYFNILNKKYDLVLKLSTNCTGNAIFFFQIR